ncbi:MAG: hypothetical protein ACI8Z1_003797 [Candidatus Azotimanducaceae bacterium]|jgi:hypothetical protein
MVGTFVQLLQNRYPSQRDETADMSINLAFEGVTRMQRCCMNYSHTRV